MTNSSSLTKLKIKRKTLADEARHIRHQEAKWKRIAADRRRMMLENADQAKSLFWDLRNHRKQVVSIEARASELAHAFIRGVPYVKVENRVYWQNFHNHGNGYQAFWKKVVNIVARFTEQEPNDDLLKAVREWRNQHPVFSSNNGNENYGDLNQNHYHYVSIHSLPRSMKSV